MPLSLILIYCNILNHIIYTGTNLQGRGQKRRYFAARIKHVTAEHVNCLVKSVSCSALRSCKLTTNGGKRDELMDWDCIPSRLCRNTGQHENTFRRNKVEQNMDETGFRSTWTPHITSFFGASVTEAGCSTNESVSRPGPSAPTRRPLQPPPPICLLFLCERRWTLTPFLLLCLRTVNVL